MNDEPCFLFASLMFFAASTAWAQDASPEDFADFVRAWDGRWAGTIERGGESIEAHAICSRASSGKAIIVSLYSRKVSGTWMLTYDASQRRIRDLWSDSSGEVNHGVVFKKDGKWVLTGKGTNAEGQALEYKNVVTISEGGNKHHWDFMERVGDRAETWFSNWDRVEAPETAR